MGRRFIWILAVLCFGFGAIGWTAQDGQLPESADFTHLGVIRLHVLANSDTPADQQLKREVRDAVITCLRPYLATAGSREEARDILKQHMDAIERVAEETVKSHGYAYPVRAETGYFAFPTKTYGDLVLPAGRYEAVKIIIGKGDGANWWCVLFPPLCFVDVTYAKAANAGQDSDRPELRLKILELMQPKL